MSTWMTLVTLMVLLVGGVTSFKVVPLYQNALGANVTLIEGAFDAETAKNVIRLAKEHPEFGPAGRDCVYRATDPANRYGCDSRMLSREEFDEDENVRKLRDVLESVVGQGSAVRQEVFSVMEYHERQGMGSHYDSFRAYAAVEPFFDQLNHDPEPTDRMVSVVFYLSTLDHDQGGHTYFDHIKLDDSGLSDEGKQLILEKKSMLVDWESRRGHEVFSVCPTQSIDSLSVPSVVGNVLIFHSFNASGDPIVSAFHGSCPVIGKANKKWMISSWVHNDTCQGDGMNCRAKEETKQWQAVQKWLNRDQNAKEVVQDTPTPTPTPVTGYAKQHPWDFTGIQSVEVDGVEVRPEKEEL